MLLCFLLFVYKLNKNALLISNGGFEIYKYILCWLKIVCKKIWWNWLQISWHYYNILPNLVILLYWIILENSDYGGSVEITKEDKIINVTGSSLLEDSGPGNRDIVHMYTYIHKHTFSGFRVICRTIIWVVKAMKIL